MTTTTEGYRPNDDRPAVDRVGFFDASGMTDAERGSGWPYTLSLGTDNERGWMIELDMENGALVAAFTPAGVDNLFHLSATEIDTVEHGLVTTARVTVETGTATWDEATRTLLITNHPEA